MSYHDLSSSGMSAEARRSEADRILGMIGDQMVKEMKAHEAKFIRDMQDPRRTVSDKQLFWLRDLKDAYL